MSLAIKNLSKKFGEKQILIDFSYDFPDKGLFILKGNSGIGKTTLLRIISGLDRDYDGEVIGGGIKNVSYAFQEHRLFPALSALKNITKIVYESATHAEEEQVKALLRELRFSDNDMQLYPNELSGGMKQRVSLVRALCKNAPILLLDEATKELDTSLADTVIELIKKEAENRLVITVTHKTEEIEKLNGTVITL